MGLASFVRKGRLPHFLAQLESSATVLVPPKKLAFVWKATIARAGPLKRIPLMARLGTSAHQERIAKAAVHIPRTVLVARTRWQWEQCRQLRASLAKQGLTAYTDLQLTSAQGGTIAPAARQPGLLQNISAMLEALAPMVA